MNTMTLRQALERVGIKKIKFAHAINVDDEFVVETEPEMHINDDSKLYHHADGLVLYQFRCASRENKFELNCSWAVVLDQDGRGVHLSLIG